MGRGLSPLAAALILVAIVAAGGSLIYAMMLSTGLMLDARTQTFFENAKLVKDSAGGAYFAVTIKNTGKKPITTLTVKLGDEQNYIFPEVSESKALQPGRSASAVIALPNPQEYIVGERYTVTVAATAADGSTFTDATTVICMGVDVGAGGGGAGGGSGGGGGLFDFALSTSDEVTCISAYMYLVPVTATKISGGPEFITFSADLPEGFSASFSPEGGVLVNELTSTATITVSGDAADGEHQLNFKAVSESGVERSTSINAYVSKYLIIKEEGDEWTNWPGRVSEAPDGGFIASGCHSGEPLIYRLSSGGRVLWKYVIENHPYSPGAMALVASGGRVIAACDIWVPANPDYMLIKCLSMDDGSEIWSAAFTPAQDLPGNFISDLDYLEGIAIAGDGVAVVGALRIVQLNGEPTPRNFHGGFIAYFSLSSGEMLWSKLVIASSQPYGTWLMDAVEKSNSEMIVVGEAGSRLYLACIRTLDGSFIWERIVGDLAYNTGGYAAVDRYGNYFIAGGSLHNPAGMVLTIFNGGDGSTVKHVVFSGTDLWKMKWAGGSYVAFIESGIPSPTDIGLIDVESGNIRWLYPMEDNLYCRTNLIITSDGAIVTCGDWITEDGWLNIVLEKFSMEGERLKWITFNP